ncbi:rnase3 domain-containing protein [Ophiostoma piceae UAMH 11346]|uniref:Rnase3 domain-containing protein n=1 Tax=Ophiostoma piceae (strain UAMH 11346) TaxID=1262450 RepID=S3C1K7_OPHP1|nr:rnase3 domain-containing protein [Ophiostoma piceae UAMH 11346]
MAKRQHDGEAAPPDAAADTIAKRQKVAHAAISPDQLALLDRFSKELRAFVKAAKKDKKTNEDSTENGDEASLEDAYVQLAELSTSVLPIFLPQNTAASSQLPLATTASSHSSPIAAPLPTAPIILSHSHVTPLPHNLAAWTPADIPRGGGYPALPPIPDPALAQMAMTHRGMLGGGAAVEAANYETLEFVGDAYIYHVAAELITQTFPRMSVGRRSQMREGLLRNANLAQYTVHYGLDKRAQIPDEFVGDGRDKGSRATDRGRQKVNGDLFEAYVGALVRAKSTDPGYDSSAVTVKWLRSLWAMTLASDIERESRRPGVVPTIATSSPKAAASTNGSAPADAAALSVAAPAAQPPAKVRLAAAIVCRGVVIRYEEVKTNNPKRDKFTNMPLFTVSATADGWGKTTFLGTGTAMSKREAGEKAAERALENGKLMKELKGKKADYLARIEAETKAKEAEPE